MVMKITRIALIIISILTLISATLALCRIVPTVPGLIVSVSLIVCEFIIQAVVTARAGNKWALAGYIVAALGISMVSVYCIVK